MNCCTLGDYFTVLRSGTVVGQAPRAAVSRQWIVERMSGRADTSDLTVRPACAESPVLHVAGLCLPASAGAEAAQAELHNISFTLHHGEILGVYGLLGAGRTELIEVLAGSRQAFQRSRRERKLTTPPSSVAQARAAGIVLVPGRPAARCVVS